MPYLQFSRDAILFSKALTISFVLAPMVPYFAYSYVTGCLLYNLQGQGSTSHFQAREDSQRLRVTCGLAWALRHEHTLFRTPWIFIIISMSHFRLNSILMFMAYSSFAKYRSTNGMRTRAHLPFSLQTRHCATREIYQFFSNLVVPSVLSSFRLTSTCS